MIKSFLILISLQIFLIASEQIILVVSDNFKSPKAFLECYEGKKQVFNTIEVNIGKNGMGWGLGKLNLKHDNSQPIKIEGDKKAPAGVFNLTDIYGYKKSNSYNLPYLHATKELICVDDVDSKYYNRIIKTTSLPKSFEYMKRDDNQYELGIVVSHNKEAVKGRGSCIFMHVQKSEDAPTAGCTAMTLENLKKIALWLEKEKKPILIQIPKSSADEIKRLYPNLKNSKLLN